MSFRLLGGNRCGSGFELVCAVHAGDGWREASVLISIVAGRPVYDFPHVTSSRGETLGNAEADAALRERVEQFVNAREAARAWDEFARSAS